ncbi:MAG: glutathione S-transferase family protein [Gammaproteobacteria bacterium]|nr:glutathione S-transferase family protein [Gammaproteobacteria bacterium]
MKLYDQQFAPNPRRLRIFMAEKGIECEVVQVNIVEGENLSSDFLNVNPRGRLPTLVLDDGTVLDESLAICRYLEEIQPDPALFGTDALSKARIEARQRHMEFDGLMPTAETFRNSYPRFKKRGVGGNVGEIDAIPELAERGKVMVDRFFKRLDEELSDSRYVAGDEFSVADITALCTIDFATTAARIPFPDQCSNVKRWYGEVSNRPSAKA